MGKLEWRWDLASGETIEARLEKGVESVYVGPRLASRSPPAGLPAGHAIDLAGKALHVKFDRGANKCALTVDGAPLEPLARPVEAVVMAAPPMPERASPWRTRLLVVGGTLVVGLGAWLGIFGAHSPGAVWERFKGENAPLYDKHQTPNALLIAQYPVDFNTARADGGTLLVQRGGGADAFLYLSVSRPQPPAAVNVALEAQAPDENPPPDLAQVATDGVAAFAAAVGAGGLDLVATSSEPGTCHDQPAVVVTGTARRAGADGALHGCAFTKYGNVYFMATAAGPDRVYQDEIILRRILSDVVVVDPAKFRRGGARPF